MSRAVRNAPLRRKLRVAACVILCGVLSSASGAEASVTTYWSGSTPDGALHQTTYTFTINGGETHTPGFSLDTVYAVTWIILGSDMGPWASVVVPDGYSRAIEALIGQGTISDESTSNVLVVPLPESMNRFAGMPEESAAAVLDVELQPDSGGLPRLHVRF
jgi:hypothetical protein